MEMTTEEISFALISKAGTAFTMLVEALQDAREKDFEKAAVKKAEAETLMNEAHNLQTDLMVNEVNGEGNEINVLLIHAQDTLMNTILMSTIVDEFIKLYRLEEK
ncbi:PTS lactose/cellobiose transporter subunit IIA [Lapidilactobacillus salsurivasis]